MSKHAELDELVAAIQAVARAPNPDDTGSGLTLYESTTEVGREAINQMNELVAATVLSGGMVNGHDVRYLQRAGIDAGRAGDPQDPEYQGLLITISDVQFFFLESNSP